MSEKLDNNNNNSEKQTVKREDLNKDNFEVINESNSSFINNSGEIVIMDTDLKNEYFELKYIDIEKISAVRRIRKNKKVDGLIKSIKETGLLMPIVVAPTATEGYYVLLSGFRRLIACSRLKMKKVPCIINTAINVPEIPIIEALYNHYTPYTIPEIIDYIEYLEKEKSVMSAPLIEYLLQLESGDYAKLKDLLNDNDEDIISKLKKGEFTISQAFRKLEQRRRKESKTEKEYKKATKVYDEEKESAEKIKGAGEVVKGRELSENEIKTLAFMGNNIDEDERTLEEMIEDGKKMDGFQPKVQKTGERELVDPALRKAVMERDRNTCRCCEEGGPEYIDVNDFHHVVPVFLGGEDSIDNAICVCVKCHKLIHLYARGQLYLTEIDKMEENERKKFKRIIKYGEIIRKGMMMQGMKVEEYKQKDNIKAIGRQMPGKENTVT